MGAMYRLLWVVFLVSCMEPDLLPCGEQLCPSDAVCQSNGRCVTNEALAACRDKATDDDCVVTTQVGKCIDGACVTAACGNGIVEPGEICDDGNRISGDGCSFDCVSHELCGN